MKSVRIAKAILGDDVQVRFVMGLRDWTPILEKDGKTWQVGDTIQ